MVKDKRYTTVAHLIRGGHIKNFRDIFDVLPKTVLAADLWMNNRQFDKLKNNVTLFRLKDLFRIAELLEVDERDILRVVHNQHLRDKESKKTN